jgi:hypothetical protein
MRKKVSGNIYRTTVVCVDTYENAVLTGRFYNPYLPAGMRFESTIRFLRAMEQMLNQMQLPKSFTAERTFAQGRVWEAKSTAGDEEKLGQQATFELRVLFRRNNTWQGSVRWVEGQKEESFRSVLELLMLMDSALR